METLEDKAIRARQFADEAHGAQLYDGRPYMFHLEQVYGMLLRFKVQTDELLIAAILHDVIEDTALNFSDLNREFGPLVAELVYAVTDELGRNRHERHFKTYPKIKALPLSITLKLADRIANVEHSIRAGNRDKFLMYRREHFEFLAGIGPAGPISMWKHLEDLMKLEPFKAPENCGFYDQDLACLGCGNRRSNKAYCNLSPAAC